MHALTLRLFNGAKTKEAWNPKSIHFIDDWKPEEHIVDCSAVQVTYGDHIKVETEKDRLEFYWDQDGFIEHDGVFYGDFIVAAHETESVA